jgi:hypothetical protein
MGWRYLGSQLPAAATPDGYLDALVTLFARVVYADGSPRVPGVGYAWSLESQEGAPREAISFQGPAGCGHSARVVVVGFNGVRTPVMAQINTPAAYETWLANCLLTMTSVGGTLSTWDGLTPMGVGIRANGYLRAGIQLAGAAGLVRAWESSKGIAVAYKNGASFSAFVQGAWIRPWNPAGALGSEPDGHLYGGSVTGSGTMTLSEDAPTGNYTLLQYHNTLTAYAHLLVLRPGATTPIYLGIDREAFDVPGANTHKTLDGEWVRTRAEYKDRSTDQAIGYAYNLGFVPKDTLGVTRYDGANPSYYVLGPNDAAVDDAFGLFHDET